MSNFTPAEIAYLQSQLLGRLATIGADGDPHVVPVGFQYNPDLDTIDIGGHGIAQSIEVPRRRPRLPRRIRRRRPCLGRPLDAAHAFDPWPRCCLPEVMQSRRILILS